MTRTFDLFRIARAIQSSCFSLQNNCELKKVMVLIQSLPSREVLSTLGYRRIEIPENVGINSFKRFFWSVLRGYQMNTTKSGELRQCCQLR
jgi:hypothetical protein